MIRVHGLTLIHLQLAKEIGFQIENRPLTFTTAAGKVLISANTSGNRGVPNKS